MVDWLKGRAKPDERARAEAARAEQQSIWDEAKRLDDEVKGIREETRKLQAEAREAWQELRHEVERLDAFEQQLEKRDAELDAWAADLNRRAEETAAAAAKVVQLRERALESLAGSERLLKEGADLDEEFAAAIMESIKEVLQSRPDALPAAVSPLAEHTPKKRRPAKSALKAALKDEK